jgi:hypothetical protein
MGEYPFFPLLRLRLKSHQIQDPIMKGEVIHDIHKDSDTQLDLVWMGSAISKGSGSFGMDLALLRCCRRIDDGRFAIVSRRYTLANQSSHPYVHVTQHLSIFLFESLLPVLLLLKLDCVRVTSDKKSCLRAFCWRALTRIARA